MKQVYTRILFSSYMKKNIIVFDNENNIAKRPKKYD